MNNRKIIVSLFVGLFVSLFISRAVFAQTEKLGLVQYTPPKGWTKSAEKEHAVVFSNINQAAGRFCLITLYSAGPTSGDAKSDFAREWNARVVQPWGAEASPKTETVPDNGWTAVARYSGTYAGADSLHYKIKMTFTAEGGYFDDFYAIQNGKMIKEKAAGSVAVSGRVLVIKDSNLRKYVIRGWLELPNMTIMEVCGPWCNDDVIPNEIFTNPAQGANLNKKWARKK
jgi:hypothetical protein